MILERVFEGVRDHLDKGSPEHKVSIVKTTKFNGTGIQIAYDDNSLCWIIGDRKTSIAALKQDDVKMYPDEDYYELKRAAECFFDFLKVLSSAELEKFKEDLIGFTLIGDYIGDYEIQKILRYIKPRLVFTAMVETEKGVDCFPIVEGIEFLESYGLPHTNFRIWDDNRDYPDFVDNLINSLYEIEEASLQDHQAGASMFLVLHKKTKQKVISLSHVHTLEYLIYKRLRIHVEDYIYEGRRVNSYFEKFTNDVYSIIGEAHLHHSLNYYLNIGDRAFNFCETFPKMNDFVCDFFVSFLSVVIYSLHQNVEISTKLFEKKKLSQIETQNWYKYSMGNLNLRHLDSRKSNRSKQSSPQPAVQAKSNDVKKNGINGTSGTNGASKPLLKEKDSKIIIPAHTTVNVVLPLTLPGTGVSQFYSAISTKIRQQDLAVDIKIIHSEELQAAAHRLNKEKEAKFSGEEYNKVLNESFHLLLEKEVKKNIEDPSEGYPKLRLVLVNKHFSPSSAANFIKSLKKDFSGRGDIKYTCLTSSVIREEPQIKIGKENSIVPFNTYSLMCCLKREFAKTSKKGNPNLRHLIDNLLCGLNLFQGAELSKENTKNLGFDGYIGFPFFNSENETDYMENSQYPEIKTAFSDLLNPSETEKGAQKIEKLLENFSSSPEWWESPSDNYPGTEYEFFLMKAISTLQKKHPKINEKKSSQPTIDIDFSKEDVSSNMEIEAKLKSSLKPLVNQNSINKRKKPDLVGLFSRINSTLMQDLLKKTVLESLSKLRAFDQDACKNFLEVSDLGLEDSTLKLNSKWFFSSEFHVSLLSIFGQPLSQAQDSLYNRFALGEAFPFLVHGMIYVPDKLIIGVVNIDQKLLPAENKYLLMNIMHRGNERKESRELDEIAQKVIEQVFQKPALNKAWEENLNSMTKIGVTEVSLDSISPDKSSLKGSSETSSKLSRAYLVPFRKKLLVDAIIMGK